MDWVEAISLVALCVGFFGVLGWVMRDGDERAGLYFLSVAVLLSLDGFVSLTHQPAFLLAFDTEFAGPIVGWLSYRGCCALVDRHPMRGDRWLALASVAVWLVAHATEATLVRVLIGTGSGVFFLVACFVLLARSAETTIQRLFAGAWVVPIVLLALHPLTETGHMSVEAEAAAWFVVLPATGLIALCFAVERRDEVARRLLRQRSEHLALGAEVAGLGLWTYDHRTATYQWDAQMYAIYGLAPDAPVPDMAEQLEAIVPPDRERFERALEAMIAGGPDLDLEIEFTTADGERRWTRSRVRMLHPGSPDALLIGTSRDTTEERAALAELESYRKRLEALVEERTAALETSRRKLGHQKRLASIGTLAAGVGHQINNPVGAIRAASEYALGCAGDEDELETLRASLRSIADEARRCGELVHDMLRFASDRPTIKKRIPLDPVVERVHASLHRTAREREATVELVLTGEAPLVEASAIELEQALVNLLENAMQSGPPGRRVRLERRTEGDQVVLAVRDDGDGIPADQLESVLDPFYTTRLDAGGTGLGLSVAHGVAREHGGDLAISSRVGEGTTVELTLPRAVGSPKDTSDGVRALAGRAGRRTTTRTSVRDTSGAGSIAPLR